MCCLPAEKHPASNGSRKALHDVNTTDVFEMQQEFESMLIPFYTSALCCTHAHKSTMAMQAWQRYDCHGIHELVTVFKAFQPEGIDAENVASSHLQGTAHAAGLTQAAAA